jgi:hypothetical protein
MGAVAIGLLAAAPAASAGTLSYGFDGGTNQGWQVRNSFAGPPAAAIANGGGGNPGGTLFYNDTAANEPAVFTTPVFAPGTLAANYGGSLSFDLHISGAPAVGEIIVFINQGVTASLVTRIQPSPTQGAFQRISFPLQARIGSDYSGIVFASPASESQWRSVLAASDTITVQFDAHPNAGDVYLLDNFLVTERPAAVQPPASSPLPTPVKKKCKKKKGKKGAEASKKKRKKCKRKKKKR